MHLVFRTSMHPLRILEDPRDRRGDAFALALAGFRASPNVDAMVAASGCSHRHFIALFEREAGLAPKRFCRVQRFRRLLAHTAMHPALS
jgi:AraC-like DNA-binding protein